MTPQEKLNHAVLYAFKEGCFYPVRKPKPTADVQEWVKWGAKRYLHAAIREFYPSGTDFAIKLNGESE